ncbi:protein cornichon homolog 1-like isoform X2 [Syngnathoides biaculeatus]|uniref:protein cornichon homolog 1-like isoform X2 n=1 Tax=Syngnathoides biaculeatus TaxID=300417 RepID=UPI002ADE3E3C|nr:protein cornichon homolog 1-like isoform X2 [Syngnathoides biaculeatus]
MEFPFAAFCFMLAVLLSAALILIAVFHLYVFDELKKNSKNFIEHCYGLNSLVLPEYGIHFCIMFFCATEWFTLLFNLPLLAYHVWRSKPARCPGVYDPITILDDGTLTLCQVEHWCKLVFYILSFIYYLYSMIYVWVTS